MLVEFIICLVIGLASGMLYYYYYWKEKISGNNIPIDISVESLSDSPKVMKHKASTNCEESLVAKNVTKRNELPFEGYCEKHFSPKHFKCVNCNEYICGICGLLMHRRCPDLLPVHEALNLMKEEKLKKIKVFKTNLEKQAKLLDFKLYHLNRKQETESVAAELKETKSKKERIQKLHEDSICHEENLAKLNCNEDFEKADAKVKFFLEENCVDILFPPLILSKEDAMKLTGKDLEEDIFYVTKNDNGEKKYAKVNVKDDQISFGEWEEKAEGGASCADILDFISSRTSVIDTHKFIKEHVNELHNPKLPKDRIKFSKIEVKEREVYFHSFQTSEGSDSVLEFVNLLKTLGCSFVIPAEAFLMLKSLSGREVVITTNRRSPRALNFLLLASGIMDDSYQGTICYKYGSVIRGGNKREGTELKLFPSVVEGIQDGGIYEREERKRGDVEGWNANNPNNLSFFRVWKEDYYDRSTTIFGRVKRGMEVVDQIEGYEKSVKECGLLFYLSLNPVVSMVKRLERR